MKLSSSLVLYKNSPDIVDQAVKSLFNTNIEVELYVVDNSPTPELENIFQEINRELQQKKDFTQLVNYFYNQNQNIGFAKAHNLAISRLPKADYHLVLNPDVYFDEQVIVELINYLDSNQDIGLIQPKICFPSGETQYLCKRYPTVLALFARRFIPKQLNFYFKNYLNWYEMRETGYNTIMDVPYLSGCFMLFRGQYLDEIGVFDENIFMYLEDADITLRMAEKYRSVFYPNVQIYHHWERGAYKSWKLTLVTIQSAIYFFNKYVWKFL